VSECERFMIHDERRVECNLSEFHRIRLHARLRFGTNLTGLTLVLRKTQKNNNKKMQEAVGKEEFIVPLEQEHLCGS
jgi:hypothetical protein